MKPELAGLRPLARENRLTGMPVMNSSGNHYTNVLHNAILTGYITYTLSTLIILSKPPFLPPKCYLGEVITDTALGGYI